MSIYLEYRYYPCTHDLYMALHPRVLPTSQLTTAGAYK